MKRHLALTALIVSLLLMLTACTKAGTTPPQPNAPQPGTVQPGQNQPGQPQQPGKTSPPPPRSRTAPS
jgi:hypothetical protein